MSDASGSNGRRPSPLTAELRQALFRAAFNMPQLKIVQCLAEVTIRRNRAGVRLSHDELAGLCGLAASGHFRDAFDELLANGVVRRLASKHGRRAAAYALNPDFVNGWGKFSESSAKLTAIFSGLDSTDERGVSLPAGRQTTNAVRLPAEGQTTAAYLPAGRQTTDPPNLPAEGQTTPHLPAEGQIKPPRAEDDTRVGVLVSSSQREILSPSTDQAPPTTNTPRTHAPAREQPPAGVGGAVGGAIGGGDDAGSVASPDVGAYGRSLAIRANQGLAQHPSRPQPEPRIMASAGATFEAAEALTTAGVPLDFAEFVVFDAAKRHNADGEVRTLKYFVQPVIRAWQAHLAAKEAEATPLPDPAPVAPTRAATRVHEGVGARSARAAWQAIKDLPPHL